MEEFPGISEKTVAALCEKLAETDRHAYDNVTHDDAGHSILDDKGEPVRGKFPRGGPFGAMLYIELEDGSIEVVGKKRGNNVIGSGIASAHAESEALDEENYKALVTRLETLKAEGKTPRVWMVSSGQSCPTCQTKQEIAARDLAEKGLLPRGQFMALYGATYDETEEIAKFNDGDYAGSLKQSAMDPGSPDNHIQHRQENLETAPPEVQEIFRQATKPTAVIWRNGQVYAVGEDTTTRYNPFATAEANAIRAACAKNKKEGAPYPWEVDGTIYTFTPNIGAYGFTEAMWTGIKKFVSVLLDGKPAQPALQTAEAQHISNSGLLQTVAGGYSDTQSYVRVFRDMNFVNTAQPMWAKLLETNPEMLYNGSPVPRGAKVARNRHTRFDFSAPDIAHCCDPVRGNHPRIRYMNPVVVPAPAVR